MAKIQEEVFIIKISKLVRDEVQAPEDIVEDRTIFNAEGLIQQMISDPSVLVEILKEEK
jgi:hypothetical protein